METLFRTDWRELWADLPVPETGSVYTRREIVALILDLSGYQEEMELLNLRLLEPSCGDGAFLDEVVLRLVRSARRTPSGIDWMDPRWESALVAVDLSPAAVGAARDVSFQALAREGCPRGRARQLAEAWIFQTDFLLHDWARNRFDFVVGNPPYVRLEDMPERVLREYRGLYRTATDRADLYIPFFERGLSLLSADGTLGFICANRFAKNQYGGALRELIVKHHHVRHYVNLEHTQPFLTNVSAYPAIIVIDGRRGAPTHAATIDRIDEDTLRALRDGSSAAASSSQFREWYPDGGPWISTCRKTQEDLSRLKQRLPLLEASAPGTRVGIGVATGADDLFVLPARSPDIESSRQIPLLMATDIQPAGLAWSGHWLLNPFDAADDGSLVRLDEHPGLARHLMQHRDRLAARHCARNRAGSWYRTIDRIWPSLTAKEKLVIPDIQPGGIVGLDAGRYYPHHNVYWVTSSTWDLRVLQAILRSDLVTRQIRAHSVAMRGGSLRYQAQSLRKLHVPAWASLKPRLRARLAKLAGTNDQAALDAAVAECF